MKKYRLFGSLFLLTLLTLLLASVFTSCAKPLPSVQGLSVDEDNVLSWEAVDSARTYTLEIKVAGAEEVLLEKSTRKTHYSLSDLEAGDYEIRIQTVGGEDNTLLSDWTETFAFHRDYETGCVYELINNNTEYQIKRGINANGVVLIESTYRGKPVTAIADNAFKGNRNVTEIVLGDNIRTIGASAFYNCLSLTTVTMTDSVTSLGVSAFQGCRALTKVTLSASIDTLPDYCFAYCRVLTDVTIGNNIRHIANSVFTGTAISTLTVPDSVTDIGEYAFSSMTELTSLTVGSGVTVFGQYAVSSNPKLETVTFAENSSLRTLGDYCFYENIVLKTVALPEGTQKIGTCCFAQCASLESVTLPASIETIAGGAFNGSKLFLESPTDLVYADKWLVSVKNLDTLETIVKDTIAEGTVGISDYCFYKAKILKSVVLPDSIERIGSFCFYTCPLLEKFEAGTSLRVIGSGTFCNCTTLYKVQMKKGLEIIGDYAFYGCKMVDNPQNSSTLLVPDTVKKIGISAFKDTKFWNNSDEYGVIYAGKWVVGFDANKSPSNVELREDVVGISDYAFSKCLSLVSLVNLSKCKYLGEGAFYGCTALGTVVLNQNLHAIEDYTFYGCTDLYRIVFPEGLVSIGECAFYHCSRISSVDFTTAEDSFESIGGYAFYGCTNLQQLRLGNSVKSIGEYAFYKCTTLVGEPVSSDSEIFHLRIPGSVTRIENHAFGKCDAVQTLILGDGVTEIGEYGFYKCAGLTTVVMPDTVTAVRANAFYSCSAIKTLTLSENLATVEQYAFFNLKALTELKIPASLRTVGKYAFKGCETLSAVILPKTLTEVLANAFYGCKNATFFMEAGTDTSRWNARWNASSRPVIMNATLSEDSSYVVSVGIGEETILNTKSLTDEITGVCAPVRKGYNFAGWHAQATGTTYAAEKIDAVPVGTVVSAVWNASGATDSGETATDTPATGETATD